MEDPRAGLAHLLWIGGGPQAGKTTLSRLLAGKWDLRLYNVDWHGAHEHRDRLGPAAREFSRLSMDDRWARPTVAELVDRSIAIYGERFARVAQDLTATSRSRTVVAGGPAVLPWSVAPLLSSSRQAIFLVPTRERRERIEVRSWGAGQVERFPGIVDRERALAKLRERDALIDERIEASCAELGLRCERIDDSLDLDDSLELLEGHFRPYLPATPNV